MYTTARMPDVSNYTGPLDPRVLADLDFGVLCVRLSLEDGPRRALAQQQLRAGRDAGKRLHGYGWGYWNTNPVRTARQWHTLARTAGCKLDMFWPDIEEHPERFNMDWIQTALEALDHLRDGNGIYTGEWYWTSKLVGNPTDLAATRSLWTAQWDGIPDLDVFRPYGGWEQCDAKQYLAEASDMPFLCGSSIVRITDP